jgi:para-aminobenzoate synthetase/4-amino-4-deoxychorismate lyase
VRIALRPDPSKGVFETMLVLGGRPVELDAHLERLLASLRALYGAALPAGLDKTVADGARHVSHGKLRVTVVPRGGRMETSIAATEVESAKVFPSAERGIALRSFVVEEGLGPHKWADRRLLEKAAAEVPRGELPLLVDRDGAVLEASRGSLFSAGEHSIATPPTDGRILPSIARRQALEVARELGIEVREERLTLADLGRQGEAFLAGSVRGVEPVRSLDGIDLAASGALSSQIAAGLRRRWLTVPQGESVAVAAGGRRAGRPAR